MKHSTEKYYRNLLAKFVDKFYQPVTNANKLFILFFDNLTNKPITNNGSIQANISTMLQKLYLQFILQAYAK